jgi:hypothetical protein
MNKLIIRTLIGLGGLAIIGVAGVYAFLLYPSMFMTFPHQHLTSPLPAKYSEVMLGKPGTYLFKDISLIPMNQDTILEHQLVLVENGKIKQIANSADSNFLTQTLKLIFALIQLK